MRREERLFTEGYGKMKLKAVSGIMLAMLLIGTLILTFNIQPARSVPTTWTVDDDGLADFTKIQDAINAASSGDTVYVYNGTYYENIVVNKSLSLVGENKFNTTIDGSGSGTLVSVTANNVNVTGFTIKNGFYGGIRVRSSYNNISGNTVMDIVAGHSILLTGNTQNIISSNTVVNGIVGVALSSSSHNTISSNILALNRAFGGGSGIQLAGSSENVINKNTIYLNDYGINFFTSTNSNNTICQNIVYSNNIGIEFYLGVSSNNTFCHNKFVNNTKQVYLTTSGHINFWDDDYPSGGNYWGDHNPPDIYSGEYQNITGSDGIGDTPYIIDGNNTDRYPLIYPYNYVFTIDLNGDGIVNILDILICASAFGSRPGYPKWNPYVDLNQDGIINILDLVIIAVHFGETV